jgi:serine/threonine protein phosphatase PrpC
MQGVLCLLSKPSKSDQSENDDPLLLPTGSLTLNLAMIGNVRCILVEAGKKVKVLTDLNSSKIEPSSQSSEEGTRNQESPEDNSSPTNQNPEKNSQTPKVMQDPVTISVPLTRSTEFLIVANQNVWNYINDKELVDELDLHRHKKSVLISKRITDMAQSHSCKDSLSLIVVRFKWNSMNTRSKNNLNTENNVSRVTVGQNGHSHHPHGPMSYFSHRSAGGSSDGNYSDELTNPLASVTTPGKLLIHE